MLVYLTRHGESEANLLGEFSNRGLKHPLTARGRRQAETFLRRPELGSLDYIYSSPVLRAVQTAEIIAGELDLPFETTPALTEFDVGILEGRSDEPAWTMFWELTRTWFDEGREEARLEGGESFLDIQARFLPFMASLHDRHPEQVSEILLVGHGGLYFCMLPLLFDNIDREFMRTHPIGYTDLIVGSGEAGGWRCLEYCGDRLPP